MNTPVMKQLHDLFAKHPQGFPGFRDELTDVVQRAVLEKDKLLPREKEKLDECVALIEFLSTYS